jgi:hypothetical protein
VVSNIAREPIGVQNDYSGHVIVLLTASEKLSELGARRGRRAFTLIPVYAKDC